MSEQGPEGGNNASAGAGGDNTGDQAGKNDAARTTADAATAQKGPPKSAGTATDASNSGTTAVAATNSDQKVAGDATGTPDGTGGDNTGVQVGKDDTARVAAGSTNKSETGTLNDTAKTGDAANATAVTATEATAQIGPAQPMKASGAADVLGDGDRVELRQTVHGAERAADPSRLSPAQQAEVIKNSTDTYTQADGATVHEQNVNGRYNIVIVSKDRVVTNLKTMEPNGRDGLAKRYGWVKN